MARAWRIEYDGALYHVLPRGNEKQDIFRDDQDRIHYQRGSGHANYLELLKKDRKNTVI